MGKKVISGLFRIVTVFGLSIVLLMFGLGGGKLGFTSDDVLVMLTISIFLFGVELSDESTHEGNDIIDDAFRGKVNLKLAHDHISDRSAVKLEESSLSLFSAKWS